MRRLFFITAFLALWFAVPTYASVAQTLCEPNEQEIWRCETKNNKMGVLCASKDLNATNGYLQYRFGVRNAVEFVFPATHEKTQMQFTYTRNTQPQATYLRVKFYNNKHAYAMEDSRDMSEGLEPEEKEAANGSWLVVMAPNTKEKRMRCAVDTHGALMKLEDFLPNEDYLK